MFLKCLIPLLNLTEYQSRTSHFQAGSLAMEALLTLTSKRAGDWFKEDLRLLGGLDHLIKTSEYFGVFFGNVDERKQNICAFVNDQNVNMMLGSTVSSEFVLVGDCVDNMGEFEVDPSEHTLMLFGKVDRCLRVLEQVIIHFILPQTKQKLLSTCFIKDSTCHSGKVRESLIYCVNIIQLNTAKASFINRKSFIPL